MRGFDRAMEVLREHPELADALVVEYRRAAGLPNAEPRAMRDHADAMNRLRALGNGGPLLVGWQHGDNWGPTGLTRLGALVGYEVNRTRTRRRQVTTAVAEHEIRERREKNVTDQVRALCHEHHVQAHTFANAREATSALAAALEAGTVRTVAIESAIGGCAKVNVDLLEGSLELVDALAGLKSASSRVKPRPRLTEDEFWASFDALPFEKFQRDQPEWTEPIATYKGYPVVQVDNFAVDGKASFGVLSGVDGKASFGVLSGLS